MEVSTLRLLSILLSALRLTAVTSSAIETVNVVDFCGQTVRGDGMVVNSHAESKKYYFVATGTDCHLTMQAASPRDKVQFHFRFFLVYSLLRVVAPLSPAPLPPEAAEPRPEDAAPDHDEEEEGGQGGAQGGAQGGPQGDPCHAGSYIQFYDGRGRGAPPVGPPLCGKSPPRPVLSTGDHLTLRLVTRGTQPRVDFVGDFTSFRLGFNQSECRGEPYFACRNGKCIPLSLVCDDKAIDNCGDGSDLEENLTTGCTAGGVVLPSQPPLPVATPPPPFVDPPTAPSPAHKNCGIPNAANPSHESESDSGSLPLLVLYVGLGSVLGGALLCWCCWSPGWLLWRVSACRLLPCCNAPCASCQLWDPPHHRGHTRPAKVGPHPPAPNGTTATAAATASANSVAV